MTDQQLTVYVIKGFPDDMRREEQLTTHPLTDDLIEKIASRIPSFDAYSQRVFTYKDMRAVADWQLEQVIKWLHDYPVYDLITYNGEDALAEELKKAMRPQENN